MDTRELLIGINGRNAREEMKREYPLRKQAKECQGKYERECERKRVNTFR